MGLYEDGAMTLYLQVTADRYELPLIIADSAVEMAEITGVSKDAIYRAVRRGSVSRGGDRFVRVRTDDSQEGT